MAEPPYPFTPPAPPHPPKTTLSLLNYGIIIIGIMVVVLLIYNLIIIKWCANHPRQLRNLNTNVESRRRILSSSRRNLDSISLGESFKYTKEGGDDSIQLEYGNNECIVCLSIFEEEDEVRELPRCKHSFHAPCIEMWLYTHLDCPLCRLPVEIPVTPPGSVATLTPEHSTEVLIDTGISV